MSELKRYTRSELHHAMIETKTGKWYKCSEADKVILALRAAIAELEALLVDACQACCEDRLDCKTCKVEMYLDSKAERR